MSAVDGFDGLNGIMGLSGGREETKEVGRVREEEEFREDRYFGVEWCMGREQKYCVQIV